MARLHRYPHQVVRYAPVLRLVRAAPPGTSVLEVGSAGEGVGSWWQGRYIGLDIKFETKLARGMLPVLGDGTRMPFADRSVDVVLCVAMLAHVVGIYEQVLPELVRVARRHVLIVTPSGPEAEASDLNLGAWCDEHGFARPYWLQIQIDRGLPKPEVIRAALEPHGRLREGATLSVPWNERFFKTEMWMKRLRGTMTAVQPALRLWGARGPRELDHPGPAYERWFHLQVDDTDR